MKVAVHLPNINPDAGGASSLLRTIQNEIKTSCNNEHEYIFLYSETNDSVLYKEVNGFKYLNLNYYKVKVGIKNKLKNKVKSILGRTVSLPSKFDMAAKDQSIDLFWFTAPVIYDISYPYIYTVWDLGHRTVPYFPEVSRSGWTWESREQTYQKMIYKASYVITGNEEGKKEILENYPMSNNKIRISPFPVASFCHGEEKKPSFIKEEPYFFYPAQFWPHKNHIVILDSLEILAEKYGSKPIVYLTGSDKGNRKYIESEIKRRGLENQIIFTGFVSDEELKYLYTHAVGMIFASLMGPNNMPPIEATYLHCPVIITDLDGHKEQLGDTALYFDGYKSDELAENMQELLSDSKFRESIMSKETELAKNFEKVNYFFEIKKIIKEFSLIRRTWGAEFVHL